MLLRREVLVLLLLEFEGRDELVALLELEVLLLLVPFEELAAALGEGVDEVVLVAGAFVLEVLAGVTFLEAD